MDEDRKLGGGAIASLTGVGVLLIFIFQNTAEVRFHFLFLAFTWPCGCTRSWWQSSERWCGSVSA